VGGKRAAGTYVLIANPTSVPATITLTALREGGRPPVTLTRDVGPLSRRTISLAEFPLEAAERCGVLVESTGPIAVERSMYWNAGPRFWSAGTNETGAPLP
jgi:hypothetical protein